MGASDGRTTIRIGVFVPADPQLLDIACIDLFASMSYEYLSLLDFMVPATMYELAPSVKISYIGTVEAGELISTTAQMKIACTHHLSAPEVQPGMLDIVLVPGPDPSTKFDAPVTDWLAGHAAAKGTDILCVCTGSFLCGAAGILKGKKVSGPRGLQTMLKDKFPDVTWVGDSLRWIQDGNVWSSGGVTTGNDLVMAYTRHSPKFPSPVVELGITLTEVADRPQRYETGKTGYTLGIVWQLVRAYFSSAGKPKAA